MLIKSESAFLPENPTDWRPANNAIKVSKCYRNVTADRSRLTCRFDGKSVSLSLQDELTRGVGASLNIWAMVALCSTNILHELKS
jgi:predicted ATP-dependent Lon-type protease